MQVGATKLARRMSAKLSGGDFAITEKTAKVQLVDDDGAEWKWSVKPKSAGPRKQLTIAAKHWAAALGAVVTPPPLLVALWKRMRRRRQGA